MICSVQPWGYSFKYAAKPWARPRGVVETIACRSAELLEQRGWFTATSCEPLRNQPLWTFAARATPGRTLKELRDSWRLSPAGSGKFQFGIAQLFGGAAAESLSVTSLPTGNSLPFRRGLDDLHAAFDLAIWTVT